MSDFFFLQTFLCFLNYLDKCNFTSIIRKKTSKCCNDESESVLLTFEISCPNAEDLLVNRFLHIIMAGCFSYAFQVTRNIHYFTSSGGCHFTVHNGK